MEAGLNAGLCLPAYGDGGAAKCGGMLPRPAAGVGRKLGPGDGMLPNCDCGRPRPAPAGGAN